MEKFAIVLVRSKNTSVCYVTKSSYWNEDKKIFVDRKKGATVFFSREDACKFAIDNWGVGADISLVKSV